jgi:hypothetical protein
VTAGEPPLFPHSGIFGPELRTRRLSAQQMIAFAGAFSAALALVVGIWQYVRTDHGSAVQVKAVAVTPVELQQTDNGFNSVCFATMAVTRPRAVRQRINVPCGVTPGQPTSAYLYADDFLSMLDPAPTWQLVITAVGAAAVVGFAAMLALTVLILLGLRLRHWLEDR